VTTSTPRGCVSQPAKSERHQASIPRASIDITFVCTPVALHPINRQHLTACVCLLVRYIQLRYTTSLYFLRGAKHVLNQKALKFIYYALFHSHLIYASQLWSCCSESLLKPIVTKQKIAIRLLSNAKYNLHTEPLFKALNILPFAQLCLFLNFNLCNSLLKNYFLSHFNQCG